MDFLLGYFRFSLLSLAYVKTEKAWFLSQISEMEILIRLFNGKKRKKKVTLEHTQLLNQKKKKILKREKI